MRKHITIDGRPIGDGYPAFIVAEIGINHNGNLEIARSLIDAAVRSGCDAVKFQKRDPDVCVPASQRDVRRETPWGEMTYLEYRHRVEFSEKDYDEIASCCRKKGILWTASCWDVNSAAFLERYDVPFHKVPSALITDRALLERLARSGKPIVFSTGMSSLDEIEACYGFLSRFDIPLAMMHTSSTYPCPVEELNLRMIHTLRERFAIPVGYSGHEVSLSSTIAAVAMGAALVERHITLDRAMWGTDQAASVEPVGFERLVRDIRYVEVALGDGVKRVYEGEKAIRTKLRAEVTSSL